MIPDWLFLYFKIHAHEESTCTQDLDYATLMKHYLHNV